MDNVKKYVTNTGIITREEKPVPQKRVFPNFITAYRQFTSNLEVTPRINTAVAFSLIAGALERKVWIDTDHGTIYPNLYTVVVGMAGMARKSTATTVGMKILKQVPKLSFFPQRITEAALFDVLAKSQKRCMFEDRSIPHSSVFCYNSELSILLKDTHGIVVESLTDLFDCGGSVLGTWSKETKLDGRRDVYGPCINILACTTPDSIHRLLPIEQLEAGFASRVLFIYEPKPPERFVPSAPKTAEYNKFEAQLVSDLYRISSLQGEVQWTQAAKEYYNEWYVKDRQEATKGYIESRYSGYYGRRALYVQKFAMILTCATRDNLTIDIDEVKGAIAYLDSEKYYQFKLLGRAGKNDFATNTIELLEFVKVNKRATFAAINNHFFRDLGTETLKHIIQQLVDMKKLKRVDYNGDLAFDYIASTGEAPKEAPLAFGQSLPAALSSETNASTAAPNAST